jgi:hypothetical protein
MPWAFLVLLVVSCATSASDWTPADTKAATDAVHAESLLMKLCDSDAGCTRGQVSAVENATLCNISSMLHRHGTTVIDASAAGCQP